MIKLFKNLSIRNKIIFIVLIISTITVTVGMVLEYNFEKVRMRKEVVDQTSLNALLISQYCGMPLEFENPEAAYTVLEKLRALPEIYDGLLFDNNDSLFVAYHKNEDAVTNLPKKLEGKNHMLLGDWLHIWQPVDYKEKHYGTLYVRAYTEISKMSSQRIVRHLILIFSMLLLAFLLSAFFQRLISTPILKLSRLTNMVSTGQDFSLRIKKEGNDEIGKLYDEFNYLLNVIETTKKELLNHKEHLEELVDERTMALKKSNEELKKAKELAEEGDRVKSEFLSNMSHELRTPLNGILGYAEILLMFGGLNKEQTEYLEIINSSGKHLLEQINEILTYSKIEAKKLQLVISDFNIQDMVKHILSIVQIRAEQKSLSLAYEKLTSLPDFVKGDEIKLRQVLLNLLSNAVKYTKEGNVTFRVGYYQGRVPNFVFEVEDTGVGIAPEQINHVFEPFTQVGDQWKFVEGTGLGLAISKRVIDLMQGTLDVESVLGQGSVFRLAINLPKVNANTRYKQVKKAKVKGYKGKRQKVLVVDDNPTNLSFLVSVLKPVGFEINMAENGKEAYEKALLETPDLILIDLVMPFMDGTETVRKLRALEQFAETKFIGVTAAIYDKKKYDEFIGICDSHIDKPVKISKLFSVIKKVLGVEWIEMESQKTAKQVEMATSHLLVPDQAIISSIIELVQMGDFSQVEDIINNLGKDKKYNYFNKIILAYIKKYDSRSLIKYLKSIG